MIPRLSAYKRNFNETKYMSFLIKDNELLEKYNAIWEKVISIIIRGFDSDPIYNNMKLILMIHINLMKNAQKSIRRAKTLRSVNFSLL